MGLFFSAKSSNKPPSFSRYKQVGRTEGGRILKGMNRWDRAKLGGTLKSLGASKKSIESISKMIGKEHGSGAKQRFMKAARKRYETSSPKQGLSEARKRMNIYNTSQSRIEEYKKEKGGLGAGQNNPAGALSSNRPSGGTRPAGL